MRYTQNPQIKGLLLWGNPENSSICNTLFTCEILELKRYSIGLDLHDHLNILGKVKSERVAFLMLTYGREDNESVSSSELAIGELGLWNGWMNE